MLRHIKKLRACTSITNARETIQLFNRKQDSTGISLLFMATQIDRIKSKQLDGSNLDQLNRSGRSFVDPPHPTVGASASMSLWLEPGRHLRRNTALLGHGMASIVSRRVPPDPRNHTEHYVLLGLETLALQFRAKDVSSRCSVGQAEAYLAFVDGYFGLMNNLEARIGRSFARAARLIWMT
ncbi:hypothetical protein EVAR_41368_1 [Eumeta japonica]|uniref:Uncharacterized protein n=1 Tax=Eumeta variegata TaxID=151549 RepID=A0A4C1XPM7_EUMVA|nr:hypothetical protein EVAR_41368_1 [Eumeta japonica]